MATTTVPGGKVTKKVTTITKLHPKQPWGDWQFEFEWKEIDGLADDDSDDVPDLEGGSAAIYPENIYSMQDKPVKVYTPDIDDVNLLMGMGFTEPAVRVA